YVSQFNAPATSPVRLCSIYEQLASVIGCGFYVTLIGTDWHPRYFGKFDSEAEAERWIAGHRWLSKLERQVSRPNNDLGTPLPAALVLALLKRLDEETEPSVEQVEVRR